MFPRPRALAALLGAAFLAVAPASAGASSASRSADAYRAVSGTPAARHAGNPREVDPERFHAFTVDHRALRSVLADAPAQRPTARRGGDALIVTLPGPDGKDERFAVQESAVLDEELAAAHPEIRTYAGVGVDDPTATVRMDLTPLGLHAAVRGAEGLWYVDPYYRDDRSLYVSYRREDLGESVHGPLVEPEDVFEPEAIEPFVNGTPRAGGTVTQHTYRLALVTDPTYAAYFGAENVLAAKATLMARVNQIYNDDVGVELQLSNAVLPQGPDAGQDPSGDALNLDTMAEMYGPNGPCGTAPCYTVEDPAQVSCDGDVLNSNITAIPQLMRGESFDIGHIALGAPGGGVAELSAVGLTFKSVGCTGIPTPVGDFFAVDYVAHEMGHQFGGNHTFAGVDRNCSTGNRNDGAGSEGPSARGTSVEPGSGSSVMAYAGICDADDLQPHSDPYFSQRSIAEIVNHTVRTYTALPEYQTVSLRSFGAGDAFRLRNGTQVSSAIAFGTGYTAAAIQAALAEIGIPGAEVTPYGTAEALGAEGFGIEFGDAVDRPLVEVVGADATTDVTGFAGETVKGGPPTNKGMSVTTSNHAPVVTAPAAATVPLRTPFTLTASGSDPDGDRLSYLWEQNDPNKPGGTPLVSNAKATGPLFRMFGQRAVVGPEDALQSPSPGSNVASADPSRTFPDLAQVLAGNTNAASGECPAAPVTGEDDPPVAPEVVECFAEFLPTAAYVGGTGVARLMHFRLTARDARNGGGGTGSADTTVRIDPTAGPFLVTSQATPSSVVADGPLAVTWNRANTDNATTNARSVRILLSTDGGATFPTVLADSTPNDDAETVTVPAGTETASARIKVEAVGGVFFDVSDAPLTITAPVPPAPEPPAPTPTTPAPDAPAPTTPAPAPVPPAPSPTTPTPTPTPATAGLRPSLSRLASRVRLSSTGRLWVRVRCLVVGTGTAPSRCVGSVRVTTRIGGRTVVIGTASLRGARAGSTVRVRLTTRGRRLATRRAGLAARVRVRVRTEGRTRTAAKAVRVLRAVTQG
jgi:hypothetical protein